MAAEEGDVFPVMCTLLPLDDDLGARESDLPSSVSSRVWRQIMARLNLNFDRFSIELEPGLVAPEPSDAWRRLGRMGKRVAQVARPPEWPGGGGQSATPYLDALRAYAARDPGRFHVPGHKGGDGADPARTGRVQR